MYPFYLGIDLHLKRTYVVLMDTEGEVIDERRLQNAEMAGYLEQHVPQETYAVLEATRNWCMITPRDWQCSWIYHFTPS